MKNLIFPVMAFCLCIPAKSQQLIWSDEFNGSGLDLTRWSYETGTGVNGNWGTGQLDRATDRPENVSIQQGIGGADGGCLTITTRRETYIDRDYTSGRINTAGKASWGPGHRIVARVRPTDVRYQGQGFAFWMMPDEVPAGYDHIMWPQGGEIDIMEYVGSIPYHNLGTVHYAWFWENNQYQDWNHGHLGAYYSYEVEQVPDKPEWISIDLSQPYSINRAILMWESHGSSYQVQVSTDGANWSDVYATTSGDGGTDDITFNTAMARYVRMYGTQRSNDWGYSLFEFQVYAPESSTNLALNRPASSSSDQASDLGPGNAVDGQTSTRWGSGLRNPGYGNYPPPLNDPNAGSNGFHTYGIDWYQDRLEFFVDDHVYHIHYLNDGGGFAIDGNDQAEVRVINGKRVNVSEYSNHFDEWHPFEHKMYVILSGGVGGGPYTYGGQIVPEAQFPCSVYIDWVRVYSLDGSSNSAPNAVASATPDSGEAPLQVSFSGTGSTDPNGDALSYSWDFGDGSTGSGSSAQHTYTAPGTYFATLTVSDGSLNDTESVEITVTGSSGGDNLTFSKTATVSSTEGSFVAGNAVDGDSGTRWASAYGVPQWIKVDLGARYTISEVTIEWERASAESYQILVSDTDSTPDLGSSDWTVISSQTGMADAARTDHLTGLSGCGRYIAIYATHKLHPWGISIFEFEAYGTACGGTGNPAPVGATIWLQGSNSLYVSSENGGAPMNCNRSGVSSWEQFVVEDAGNGLIALKGSNGQYVTGTSPMYCNAPEIASVSSFAWEPQGTNTVALLGSNGLYVTSENGNAAMNCNRAGVGGWEVFTWGTVSGVRTGTAPNGKDKVPGGISLFPNPVHHTLNLTIDRVQPHDRIRIFSLSGRQLIDQAIGAGVQSIDVSHLKPGLYMLKFSGSREDAIRFIKQ